jgi:hypothetical protein
LFDGRASGAPNLPSLTLTDVLGDAEGTYSVVVTNLAGKATSTAATLRVGSAPPPGQTLTDATFADGVFSVSIQSQAGVNYVLEYKNALTDPLWQTAGTVAGTGALIVLSESGVTGPTRFYRVLIQ